MTKRSILSLACKVYGVIFLAQTVAWIPRAVQSAMMYLRDEWRGVGNPTALVLFEAASVVLGLAIASVLIGSSGWIARVLLPEDQQVALPDVRAHGKAVLELACRVVGVVLLAQAMPALVRVFSAALIREAMVAGEGSRARDVVSDALLHVRIEQWSELIGYGATLLIGLCLIFLAGRLGALLYSVPRDSGREDA